MNCDTFLSSLTIIDNPGATPDTPVILNYVDSCALLKRVLTGQFPGVKFTVRMSRGTAYGMVHVKWSDGPTSKAVSAITARFEGEGFDAMTDMATYQSTNTMYDAKREQWVRPRLRLINETRLLGVATVRAALATAARFWGGIDRIPEVRENKWGGWEFCDHLHARQEIRPANPTGRTWYQALDEVMSNPQDYEQYS